MPNVETPYAEIKAVARYTIKAQQRVTGLPGSMNLDWQKQVHMTVPVYASV